MSSKLQQYLIRNEQSLIYDPYLVGDILNNFFINAVDNIIVPSLSKNFEEGSRVNKNIQKRINKIMLCFNEASYQEIEQKKSLFKNKKSGYDEVPITVIKQAYHCISMPLAHLINSPLISGIKQFKTIKTN